MPTTTENAMDDEDFKCNEYTQMLNMNNSKIVETPNPSLLNYHMKSSPVSSSNRVTNSQFSNFQKLLF